MKIKIISLIILLIPFFAKASNIDDILSDVSQNNLELKMMQEDIKANTLGFRTTNNLQDPNVDFEYLFGKQSTGDKWAISISQPFDWPGLYGARKKLIDSQVSALYYVFLKRKLEILSQTKLICIEIINTNEQIKFVESILANMSEINSAYQKGFSHGEISILDINKLKIEMLNVSQQRTSLVRQKANLIADIQALNGNQPINANMITKLDEYPSPKLAPFESYSKLISETDPEYNYLSQNSAIIEEQVKVAKMEGMPSFSLGYKYTKEIGEPFQGVTASLSIPIFSSRNKVTANKAQILVNEYAKQNIMSSKQTKALADYEQLVELDKQIKEYSEVLGDGENIKLLKKALDGGQINLLAYLTELKYFIEAQKQLIDMNYQYQEILTRLNKYVLL